MRLRVEAEVRPTEAQEKVEAAIRKIFPTLELVRVGNSVVGESTDVGSLSRLHQLLRQQAILDSARSVMLAGKRGGSTQIMLNKQVAFVGKVNFTDGESPLGPIVATLEAPDLERLIDYLAPRTREGKPIHEITY
ncbi:MAG: RNA-binding domain-containing protein [Hadesarchaea archaeon]|nr:RNA-binding domain-containing protein [Hadesarchaea archaeon]